MPLACSLAPLLVKKTIGAISCDRQSRQHGMYLASSSDITLSADEYCGKRRRHVRRQCAGLRCRVGGHRRH